MATKSIYKNINIKDKKLAKGLVNALEHTSFNAGKDIQLTKAVKELKKSDLRNYFKF